MIYLASPYHHPDATVRHARFLAAREKTASLIRLGIRIYSPIVYSHQFAVEFSGIDPRWEYWKPFDLIMLDACVVLHVLCLPGWRESVGVTAEITHARATGKRIAYCYPDNPAAYDSPLSGGP